MRCEPRGDIVEVKLEYRHVRGGIYRPENKNIISIEDEMRKGGKGTISNTIYVDEEKERTKDRSLGNT